MNVCLTHEHMIACRMPEYIYRLWNLSTMRIPFNIQISTSNDNASTT